MERGTIMLIVVVGENSSGKSQYLRYLRKTTPGSYFIGEDKAMMYPVNEQVREDMYGDDYPLDGFVDKSKARMWMENICRDCALLLVDELGRDFDFYVDGRYMSTWVAVASRYKDVVMVTHDHMKLGNADRIVTVSWDSGKPVLHDVTFNEAELITHG